MTSYLYNHQLPVRQLESWPLLVPFDKAPATECMHASSKVSQSLALENMPFLYPTLALYMMWESPHIEDGAHTKMTSWSVMYLWGSGLKSCSPIWKNPTALWPFGKGLGLEPHNRCCAAFSRCSARHAESDACSCYWEAWLIWELVCAAHAQQIWCVRGDIEESFGDLVSYGR